MQAPLPISGPLSLGDLLDRAFRLYRAHFGTFILTAALFLAPVGIASGLLFGNASVIGFVNLFARLMDSPNAPSDGALAETLARSNRYLAWSYLFNLLALLANALVTLALVSQCIAALHNEVISFWAGIRRGLGRFFAYLGMSIVKYFIIGVATMGLAVLVGCALSALVFAGQGAGVPGASSPLGEATAAAFFIFLACFYVFLILLIIAPFFYLTARWIVAAPGLVDQRWGPVEALRNSWVLTSGQVWRCFGYVFLLFLLYAVIYLGLVILGLWSAAALLAVAPLASASVFAAVSTLLPILWQPLAVAATVLLYYDLRVRQESYDLTLRVQQLEAEVSNATS